MLYSAFPIRKTAVLLLAPLKDSFMHELPLPPNAFSIGNTSNYVNEMSPTLRLISTLIAFLYILK